MFPTNKTPGHVESAVHMHSAVQPTSREQSCTLVVNLKQAVDVFELKFPPRGNQVKCRVCVSQLSDWTVLITGKSQYLLTDTARYSKLVAREIGRALWS